jgi:hypothetical protein
MLALAFFSPPRCSLRRRPFASHREIFGLPRRSNYLLATPALPTTPRSGTRCSGSGALYHTRIGLGPELVYMRGPGSDRDVFLTGNLTFDLLSPRQGHPRRVSPFLVAGGGFFRNTNRYGTLDFSYVEGAFTAGGGARVWINDRVYAVGRLPDWVELHYRLTGGGEFRGF